MYADNFYKLIRFSNKKQDVYSKTNAIDLFTVKVGAYWVGKQEIDIDLECL